MLRLTSGAFDKLFSLDIPWSTGVPEMNTRQKIMELNDSPPATVSSYE